MTMAEVPCTCAIYYGFYGSFVSSASFGICDALPYAGRGRPYDGVAYNGGNCNTYCARYSDDANCTACCTCCCTAAGDHYNGDTDDCLGTSTTITNGDCKLLEIGH